MIARCTSVLVAAVLGGCTLLNAPDPKWLDAGPPNDAMGRDGGVPDTGTDGGPQLRETTCDNGEDDDLDGLTDCRDFDCAGTVSCCTGDDPEETKRWSDFTGWTVVPSSPRPPPPRIGGGDIIDFGDVASPRAVVNDFCTPLATGLEISVDLTVTGAGDCPGGADCYAAIVLSSANDMAEGNALLDELAVRLVVPAGGDPEVRVTRNAETLARHSTGIALDSFLRIEVQVSPTLDDLGIPSMAATVRVRDMDLLEIATLIEEQVFMPQDQLISDRAGCTQGPGLFMAVEGVGGRVRVGPLTWNTRQCVNPGQFRSPADEGAILTSNILGFDDWAAEGGVSYPAIASTVATTGGSRWDVLVDGTDVERRQEQIYDIGFAIGHAYALPGGWDSLWRDVSPGPRLGDCHPSCIGAETCGSTCEAVDGGRRGLREPSVYAETTSDDAIRYLHLAYAQEDIATGAFSIALDGAVSANPDIAILTPDAIVAPSGDCRSLRDPSLVPAKSDLSAWWLFYTCEKTVLAQAPEIHAVQLNSDFMIVGDARPVLTGADFGDIASSGVRAPEVLVSLAEGTAYFRVWATAIRGDTRTIVLATAEMPIDPVQLPERFTPYPDNPVLTLDDMDCVGGTCSLLGMAVTRRMDRLDTLRFLVARYIDTATGRAYQLVPLEQIWP